MELRQKDKVGKLVPNQRKLTYLGLSRKLCLEKLPRIVLKSRLEPSHESVNEVFPLYSFCPRNLQLRLVYGENHGHHQIPTAYREKREAKL